MRFDNSDFRQMITGFAKAQSVRIIDESCDTDIQYYIDIVRKKLEKYKIPHDLLFSHYQGQKYTKFIHCDSLNTYSSLFVDILHEIYYSDFSRTFSIDSDFCLLVRLMTMEDYLADYGKEIL